MTYNRDTAARYEAEAEHRLPPQEAQAWLDLLTRFGRPKGRVLDIGAGTGLLTSVLKSAGFAVVGLEPSHAMIAQGIAATPQLGPDDFVNGLADDESLFPTASFDGIVSRQVLCHLADPTAHFRIWHTWLRPGGHAILVDGFWRRSGWGEAELAAQPFAALTSTEPVAEALARAGFDILRAGRFDQLNTARRAVLGESATRYVVVAMKK